LEDEILMTAKKAPTSRRDFMRRAAYVAPAILSLAVAPSYAKAGSEKGGGRQEREERLRDWLEELLEWWRDRR
jgi:hypothetical protein